MERSGQRIAVPPIYAFERLPGFVDYQEDAKQVLWVDFDSDGDKDLHVTTFMGIDHLYRTGGDLTFTDVTSEDCSTLYFCPLYLTHTHKPHYPP